MNRILLSLLMIFSGSVLYGQCSFNIDVPADLTICEPQLIDLVGSVSGDPYLYVAWEGTNGFVDDQLVTSDVATTATNYTLTAFGATDINLVENGDFEAGNTAFTSSYLNGNIFCPQGPFNPYGPLGCEGMYVISDDPSETHTNFTDCGDHTSGSGQMMVVNGSANAINIWCQNISVTAGNDYLFSAWATSVNPSSPAILQFSINSNLIGSDFGLSGAVCTWENFTAPWSTGTSTTATICITNQNTALGGNDFAIDDIGFLEVCKQENSFDVTIAEVLGALPSTTNIDCDNDQAELSVSPNNPNYSYNWEANFGGTFDGPNNQASIIGLTEGLYRVTVTDESGCTKTITSSIFGSTALPTSDIVGEFEISCAQPSVMVFASNTDSDISYNWIGSSDNSTLPFANYNTDGNFLLEITNEYNCTSLIPFTISNSIVQPDYDLIANDTLACIGDAVEISADFAEDPESLDWFDPQGNNLGSGMSITVGDVGYYTIEFEYANNCNFVDSVLVVSQVSQLDYSLSEPAPLTCADTTQELTINVNSPFSTITWYNDTIISNDPNITVTDAGSYIVEVADPNGCITRDTVELLEDTSTPPFAVTTTDIDCTNGSGILQVEAENTTNIVWTLPDGSTAGTDSITSILQGDHILTLEYANGCTAVDTVFLAANQDFPVLSVDFDSLGCLNPTGSISISSNIDATDFNWVGPNGFSSTEDTLTSLTAGIYVYTAITESGCSSTDTITLVSDFTAPELTLTTDSITCANLIATVILETNTDFEIVNIVSNDVVEQYQDSIHIGAAGMTTITIQGTNGCTTTEVIQIPQNFTLPEFIDIDDFQLDCNLSDSTVTSLALGDETVNWFVEGILLSEETSVDINSEGNYQIIYTNQASGCTQIDNIEVTEDFQAEEFFITGTPITCNVPLAAIALGTSQAFESIDFDSDLTQETEDGFSTSLPGTYNFIVTYENGCTSENSYTVEIDTISPTVSTTDITLPCDTDVAEITAAPSAGELIFIWSGPEQFSSMDLTTEVTTVGDYTILVIDALNGCTATSTLTLSENQTEISTDFSVNQPNCVDDLGSAVILEPTGGTAPYQVTLLDNNLNPVDETNLVPGIYFISIGDTDGCGASESFEIVAATPFSISTQDEVTISVGAEQSLLVSTQLDENEIGSINWSPSEFLSCNDCINPELIGLTEDQWFYVEVQDQNGCAQFDSVFVRVLVDYSFYEANTFTPDDNGINDIFFIQSNIFGSTSVVKEFNIYDRWGNKVFGETNFPPNDPSFGWDGKINGKGSSQGVYAYYAVIELPDGKLLERKGSVTIVR